MDMKAKMGFSCMLLIPGCLPLAIAVCNVEVLQIFFFSSLLRMGARSVLVTLLFSNQLRIPDHLLD